MNRRTARPRVDAREARHVPANTHRRCALGGPAILVVLGTLLCGGKALNAEEEKAEALPYYARIEVYGVFGFDRGPGGPMYVVVPYRPKRLGYPLDVSKLKGWTAEKWKKLEGRTVHLTGTLEYRVIQVRLGDQERPGVKEERVVIVVDRLQVVDEDFPKPTP